LQINITNIPLSPFISDKEYDFPSTPGKLKSGAFHPNSQIGVASATIKILF
jgi:hypothetical protein